MTVQELLIPRYKVIADYPLSKMYFNVGDVLTWDEKNQAYRIGEPKFVSMSKETVEAFPHLFKKLEWYEERKPEELPKFVKDKFGERVRIIKVKKIEVGVNQYVYHSGGISLLENVIPASKEEYEAYNQPA